jgi:DNA-binding PadR family transcriptional regulator
MQFHFWQDPSAGPWPMWWGGGGGRRRRFKRGMLKWVILKLLAEGARHGYDVMREFEERGWGRGRGGSIYPVLMMLEEAGFVTTREENGKRIYVITEKGLEHLRDAPNIDDEMHGEHDEESERDNSEVRQAVRALMAAVMQAAHTAKPETVQRIAERLNAVRKEIYGLLANE